MMRRRRIVPAKRLSVWPILVALLVTWFATPRFDTLPTADGNVVLVRTSRMTLRTERLDENRGWVAIPDGRKRGSGPSDPSNESGVSLRFSTPAAIAGVPRLGEISPFRGRCSDLARRRPRRVVAPSFVIPAR